jgi:hypothetical protein
MATMTLKNVPVDLLARLKEEARQNHRTLNQEALARLETSVRSAGRSGSEVVKALRRLHRRMEGMPPLTDAFLIGVQRHRRVTS